MIVGIEGSEIIEVLSQSNHLFPQRSSLEAMVSIHPSIHPSWVNLVLSMDFVRGFGGLDASVRRFCGNSGQDGNGHVETEKCDEML